MGKRKAEMCQDALRCPFCGEYPQIQPWHGGSRTKCMVACENDDCAVQPSVTGETKGQAVASWNTRHP